MLFVLLSWHFLKFYRFFTLQANPALIPDDANPNPPYDLNCPRRGAPLVVGARWTIGENTARSSNISAEAIIGSIAAFDTSHRMDLCTWVSSMLDAIKDSKKLPVQDSGLSSLMGKCSMFSGIGVGWCFMTMLSRMQLAAECLRYVFGTHSSP
jgi:hypothetical protein